MRKKLFTPLLIAVSILSLNISAQTTQTFTLKQTIDAGIAASKTLALSNSKTSIADTKYEELASTLLPQVKLQAYYSRLSPIDPFTFTFPGSTEPITLFPVYLNSYQSKLSASEILFSGFRLKYAMESANYLKQLAQLNADKDNDEVTLNLINAWFNLFKIQETQKVIDENLKQVQQHVVDVTNFSENGLATENDLLKVQLLESNMKLQQMDMQNTFEIANYNLNLMLGLTGSVNIKPDTAGVFANQTLQSLAYYQQNAISSRAETKMANIQISMTQDNLKISQNSVWPTIGVGANLYEANPNQRIIPPTNEFRTTWDVGVNMNWDITNLFTNQKNVAEQTISLQQANTMLAQSTDLIKMEVNTCYQQYESSVNKLDVLQLALEQSKQNYDQLNNKYLNNLALLSDVTDAQTAVSQAKINLVEGKADAALAWYKLQKAAGLL